MATYATCVTDYNHILSVKGNNITPASDSHSKGTEEKIILKSAGMKVMTEMVLTLTWASCQSVMLYEL